MISVAIRSAMDKLLAAGLAFEGDFKGCTEQEILSVEDHFRLRLPACYRDFLTVMGRQAGDFLVGTDYSFTKLLRFRAGLEALLRECRSGIQLPQTAFVFCSHQGYSYLFFDCTDGSNDPPVMLFTDSEKEPRQVAERFSAWLHLAVDDDIAAYRKLRRG